MTGKNLIRALCALAFLALIVYLGTCVPLEGGL